MTFKINWLQDWNQLHIIRDSRQKQNVWLVKSRRDVYAYCAIDVPLFFIEGTLGMDGIFE